MKLLLNGAFIYSALVFGAGMITATAMLGQFAELPPEAHNCYAHTTYTR